MKKKKVITKSKTKALNKAFVSNSKPVMGKNKKQSWVISVNRYGSFIFEGNEIEAEEMRKHKANLEQGVGRKRLADKDELQTGVIKQCKNHPNFTNRERYVCKCGEC